MPVACHARSGGPLPAPGGGTCGNFCRARPASAGERPAWRPAISIDTPGLADTAPVALGGLAPPPRSRVDAWGRWRWGLAALLAGLALLAQWLIHPWVGGRLPFIFVLPAVMLAAALWGRALGAAVLGVGLLGSVPLLLLPDAQAAPGGRLLLPMPLQKQLMKKKPSHRVGFRILYYSLFLAYSG